MNIVILSGEVISKIEFDFIYSQKKKNKHISIAKGKMKLEDGSIIEIYGYDEIADMLYQCEVEKYIIVKGRLDNDMRVEITEEFSVN